MKELLFLDVEATGVDEEDRLLQVAYKYKNETVNELFKPPVPIKKAAMAIHHVTDKHVADMPDFEGSRTKVHLNDISLNKGVLVAHNAKYDLGMLEKEGVLFDDFICTLKIARHIDTDGKFENHQLQYLRYFYDLEIDLGELSPHDALADIIVLEEVFYCLANELCKKEGIKYEDVFDRMIEISKLPSLLRVCNFKKHKGKTWSEVARIDLDYLTWFLGKDDLDEDLKYTLEFHVSGGQTKI